MKFALVKRAAAFSALLAIGALFIGPLFAAADSFWGPMLIDTQHRLVVNCEIGCSGSSAGGSTSSPAYTRVQDGTSTGLAAVGTSGSDNASNAIYGLFTQSNNWLYRAALNGWDRQQECTNAGTGFACVGGNSSANSDGVSSANDAIDVRDFLFGFNGSTWDRVRELNGAIDTGINSNGSSPGVNCDQWKLQTGTTTTVAIAHSGSTNIYICGLYASIETGTTASENDIVEYGSGSTCGTGSVALWVLLGNPSTTAVVATGSFTPARAYVKIPSGDDVCVQPASGMTSSNVTISYAQTANGP